MKKTVATALHVMIGLGPILATAFFGFTPQTLAMAAPATGGARANAAQTILECRAIVDDHARLSCYDKASDAFDKARAEGRVVVVDQEQVNAVRRQAFGLNLSALALLPFGPRAEKLTKLTVTVANAYPQSDGKWVLVTTDKAVWRQTDNNTFIDDPHAGSIMLVREGVLGSFFCKIDGQSAIRCARDR